jgi:hypothetical protein
MWMGLCRYVVLTLVAIAICSAPAVAQEETSSELEGTSDPSQVTRHEWHTWYGNRTIVCTGRKWGPGVVSVTVRLWANGQQIGVASNGGWQFAEARIPFDPLNSSPAEMLCQADGATGRTLISSGYYGSYELYTSTEFEADYVNVATCTHIGMLSAVVMTNPAPGFPDVFDPPAWMQDQGFWVYGSGFSYGMRFYITHDFGVPPCIAPT